MSSSPVQENKTTDRRVRQKLNENIYLWWIEPVEHCKKSWQWEIKSDSSAFAHLSRWQQWVKESFFWSVLKPRQTRKPQTPSVCPAFLLSWSHPASSWNKATLSCSIFFEGERTAAGEWGKSEETTGDGRTVWMAVSAAALLDGLCQEVAIFSPLHWPEHRGTLPDQRALKASFSISLVLEKVATYMNAQWSPLIIDFCVCMFLCAHPTGLKCVGMAWKMVMSGDFHSPIRLRRYKNQNQLLGCLLTLPLLIKADQTTTAQCWRGRQAQIFERFNVF